MAAISQARKAPKAPPVYRPEQKRIVQPKACGTTPPRRIPPAPPVYRPQPTPKVLQRQTSRQPVAPPVRRPQPAPGVLQPPPRPLAGGAARVVQRMEFARFKGFGFFTNWVYNNTEKELLKEEAATVKAVNAYHDLLHKRYGRSLGKLVVLPAEDDKRLVALIQRLSKVRNTPYAEKDYVKAGEELKNLRQEAESSRAALLQYEKARMERKAEIREAASKFKATYTLNDLPKNQWWKLYIDAIFHKDAEKLEDPGLLFDRQQSPGYKQSMMEAFEAELSGGGGLEFKEMEFKGPSSKSQSSSELDYEGYTNLHNRVIRYTSNEQQQTMKKLGGRDEYSQFSNTSITKTKDELEQRERHAALAEMQREMIGGMPLLIELEPVQVIEEHSPGITIHFDDTDNAHMDTNYAASEGKGLVNTILKLYYDGRKSKETVDAKLRRIVKTIRALHVGHFFGDANGRLNIFLLLNKLLIEEGFSPAILPNNPDVFGGLKTLDGLVQDVLKGMKLFQQEVERSKKNI